MIILKETEVSVMVGETEFDTNLSKLLNFIPTQIIITPKSETIVLNITDYVSGIFDPASIQINQYTVEVKLNISTY